MMNNEQKPQLTIPRVTITLPLDIVETLQGLVDGCNGSSEDDEFSRQMNIVLKKLDKAISKHYA